MPTLDEVSITENPAHVLLVADSKVGKSTYAAKCAIDGWTLIYIDSDNGISALKNTLKNHPEAEKRVIYFHTEHPAEFQRKLFEESVFRWNLTQDCVYGSGMAKPTDKMVEIIPMRIPRGIILVNDSWTATALDAMEVGADNKKTKLEQMAEANKSQAVYGDAGLKLTLLLAIYQQCRFHILVLAHPTVFEVYEKPLGVIGEMKQRDMKLLDSLEIPSSCSRPHGRSMGKYFTDIGWIELDRIGNSILDYTRQYKRISGGRPNVRDGIEKLSFTNTFGPVIPNEISDQWIRHYTSEEWIAVNRPPAATPPGVKQPGVLPTTPAKTVVDSLLRKA